MIVKEPAEGVGVGVGTGGYDGSAGTVGMKDGGAQRHGTGFGVGVGSGSSKSGGSSEHRMHGL